MIERTGIPEERARAILAHAAEMDRRAGERVSVETLRAAAREAGISESAFAAALREHERGEVHARKAGSRRRALVAAFAGIGVTGALLVGAAVLSRIVF